MAICRFLEKGWVNTLMASAKTGSASRGRYAQAGYTAQDERELYISAVPAGSLQDDLRDLNRPGYRSARPWNDGPQPVWTQQPEETAEAPVVRRRTTARKKKMGLFEKAAYYARKDRKGVALCAAMCVAILMITAAWGSRMVDGVALARDIAAYKNQTLALEEENEALIRQLETASSGERIRNLAQNELGMLRPERAKQETVYIRTHDYVQEETVQENPEPQMELLDILLGLFNVFHIGE